MLWAAQSSLLESKQRPTAINWLLPFVVATLWHAKGMEAYLLSLLYHHKKKKDDGGTKATSLPTLKENIYQAQCLIGLVFNRLPIEGVWLLLTLQLKGPGNPKLLIHFQLVAVTIVCFRLSRKHNFFFPCSSYYSFSDGEKVGWYL